MYVPFCVLVFAVDTLAILISDDVIQSGCNVKMTHQFCQFQDDPPHFTVQALLNQTVVDSPVLFGINSTVRDDLEEYLVVVFEQKDDTAEKPSIIDRFTVKADGQVVNCMNRKNDSAVVPLMSHDKSAIVINWNPFPKFVGSVQFQVTYVKNASGCWPTVVSDVMKVVQSPIQYQIWILFSIVFGIVFLLLLIQMGLVIHKIRRRASRTEDNNHSEYTSLLGGEQIHLRNCFNCCSTRSD